MGTANHHSNAAGAEPARKAIGVKCGRRRGRNRYEIRRHVEPHRFDDFVSMRNRVLRRRERRDQRHRQLRELNETTTAEAPRLRRFRGNKMNAHEPDATGDELFGERCSGATNRARPRVELKVE
jgi:hypothetical protein